MQRQSKTFNGRPVDESTEVEPGEARRVRSEQVLQSALRKLALGVPTFTVPEAAALLSRSQEHLYRLIRSDAFPAVDLSRHGDRRYYIVPAKAVAAMLDAAAASGGVVHAADFCTAGSAR